MNTVPIPVYFPYEKGKDRTRTSSAPVATVVVNPSTGKLELRALGDADNASFSSSRNHHNNDDHYDDHYDDDYRRHHHRHHWKRSRRRSHRRRRTSSDSDLPSYNRERKKSYDSSHESRPPTTKAYSLVDLPRRTSVAQAPVGDSRQPESTRRVTDIPPHPELPAVTSKVNPVQKRQEPSQNPLHGQRPGPSTSQRPVLRPVLPIRPAAAAQYRIAYAPRSRPPILRAARVIRSQGQRNVRFTPRARNPAVRRRSLSSSTRAIRRSSLKHPWTAASISYGVCAVTVLSIIFTCFYVFSTSSSGQSLVQAAMHYIGFDTTTQLAASKRSYRVSLVVEVLPNVTDMAHRLTARGRRGQVISVTSATSATTTPFPSCHRQLCDYQTSRFRHSSHIHPCDNFHRFVCNYWVQDKSNDSLYFEADQAKKTEKILGKVLTAEKEAGGDVATTLYEMCKEYVSFVDSKQHISSLLEHVGVGRWPYQDIIRTKKEMWEIHAKIFRTLGTSSLVSISLVEDPRNASRSVINLDTPDLFLYELSDGSLPPWYVPALYRAIGIFDPTSYENVSQRVLKFASKLAQLKAMRKERPRTSTVASLPFYIALIKYSFAGVLEVTATSSVVIKSQAYLRALKSLIGNTRSADVYSYLGYRVVLHISPLLSDEFDVMSRARMAKMSGRWQTVWPRWQRCLWFIDDMDPVLLLKHFRNYTGPMSIPPTLPFHTSRIKSILSTHVSNIEWCQQDRAVLCHYFVNTTSIEVVDPFKLRLLPVFNNVTGGSFVDNYVDFKQKSFEIRLQPQYTTRARLSASLSAFSYSVWYDTETGTLYLPIASAYNTFYNLDRDMFLFVPYLAQKILSELLERLHSYMFPSDQLILNLGQVSEKCARYNKRQSGIHGQWPIHELMIDVTSWYLTYQYCLEDNWPGINLIHGMGKEKNFFVLAGMGRCRNRIGESVLAHVALNAYVAEETLVNEPFLNMKPFGSVWNCPMNSSMNPMQMCTLWSS